MELLLMNYFQQVTLPINKHPHKKSYQCIVKDVVVVNINPSDLVHPIALNLANVVNVPNSLNQCVTIIQKKHVDVFGEKTPDVFANLADLVADPVVKAVNQ